MGVHGPRVLLRRRGGVTCAVALAIMAMLVIAAPAQADVTSVSGGAFGEYVNATPAGLANVTSGPLPTVTLPSTGGGPFTNSALSACVPSPSCSILKTGVLSVSTQGAISPSSSPGATSSASVANVDALAGTPAELTASAVSSQCSVTPNSASGSTTIVGGSFGGHSLDVNPPPNTTITVDGQRLVLNEQTTTGGPGDFSMTVNAVHLYLGPPLFSSGSEIIISQSRCGEAGPNVTIPVAPIGILGAGFVIGAELIRRQWRRSRGDGGPKVTAH